MAEAAHVQVFIDPSNVTGLPQVHQAVKLVDERRWGRAWSVKAQAGAFALVPLLQAHGAARALFWFGCALFAYFVVFHKDGLPAGTRQQVVAADEISIFEVAGDGVEDARPDGSALHVEIVAVQQVV